MAHRVIERIASDIRSVDCGNAASYRIANAEEVTRYVVAQAMLDEDRIIGEDEIYEIADDAVQDESVPYLESLLDGDVCRMTNLEWENVPEERKVIDTDGDSSVVIDGRVYKVTLVEDTAAADIAERLTKEIEGIFNIFCEENDVALDMNCYRRGLASDGFICPSCGSDNVNPVWYDNDSVVLNCADCGMEWDECIGCDDTEVVQTEETEIVHDGDLVIDGCFYIDPDSGRYVWEVWQGDECVYVGTAGSAEEVGGIFADLRDSYAQIERNLILHDALTGESESVLMIDGGTVVTSSRNERIARVAYEVSVGAKIADRSEIVCNAVIEDDCYTDGNGNEICVVEVGDDGTVMFTQTMVEGDDVKSDYMSLPQDGFFAYLDANGYSFADELSDGE